MHMAAMRNGGFAVITPSAGIIPKKFALARKYHVEEQLKAVVVSKEMINNLCWKRQRRH